MNLLLDTHVLLWWLMNSPRLSGKGRKSIEEAITLHVSAASAWEIEVKRLRGLEAPEDLPAALRESGIQALNITISHAVASARLPGHHHDPFDRILLAQAAAENLVLCTADEMLARYEVPVLLV
ncbi:MAG: type II toxin-antitoxin system VapC family toxin [Acidobacteriota bacterium]